MKGDAVKPPLATRLHRRIWALNEKVGDLSERLHADWLWDWWPLQPMHAAVCRVYGHRPERDQCGIPAHDYCGWCRASTPGQWKAGT